MRADINGIGWRILTSTTTMVNLIICTKGNPCILEVKMRLGILSSMNCRKMKMKIMEAKSIM